MIRPPEAVCAPSFSMVLVLAPFFKPVEEWKRLSSYLFNFPRLLAAALEDFSFEYSAVEALGPQKPSCYSGSC